MASTMSYPSPRASRTPSVAPTGRTTPSVAFDAMGKRPRQPLLRPAQPLTWTLANHSKAYLEEQQYASGYTFLNTLLTTGASISTPAKPYRAYLAPASQLALASTLIAYPNITTKAKLPDSIKGADAAVRYLRNVQTTIDPTDETLRSAFGFGERSRRRGQRSVGGSPTTDAAKNMDRLTGFPATTQSLLHRSEDFWHVIGWAFNCSRAHKKRWERWKIWLEIMLDFLEADWEARLKLSREEDADREDILLNSLIWDYIASEEQKTYSRITRTRLVRAILSMATKESLKEFPEIWVGETLELKPRQDSYSKTIAKAGSEEDEWGDIRSDDEDVVMEDIKDDVDVPVETSDMIMSRRSSSSSLDSDPFDPDSAIDQLGGLDAINLRQRLLNLLTQVALHLPHEFTDTGNFFDASVADVVLPLPTSVFALLLSTSEMTGGDQIALLSNLLFPLVSAKVPNYTVDGPTQSHFEDMLLPIHATTQTFEKNAKVSLLLEQMFIIMISEKAIRLTPGLRKAVESGIVARNTVRGKKTNAQEEEQAKSLIEASADRLLGLLEVLEVAAGLPPQERKTRKKTPIQFTSFGSPLSSAPEDLTSPEDSGSA